MGIIKRCGLFGLLFGLSFIGSLGLLSDNASAVSYADTWISTTDNLYVSDPACNANERVYFSNTVSNIFNDPSYWTSVGGETTRQEFADNFITSQSSGAFFVMNNRGGTGSSTTDKRNIIFIYSNSGFILNWHSNAVTVTTPVDDDIYFFNVLRYSDCSIRVNYASTVDNNSSQSFRTVGGEANEQTPTWYDIFSAQGNIDLNLPSGYEGADILTGSVQQESDWTPDIKLLKGSNWLVELSDYNFFTFDKVAFTCGDDGLAPIINWEVWDITDDENRVLIDTLIFGAPSLVKYQAPKVQVDKRYEIVAYYSDCEGYTFTDAETRQFTVKKDGNLKSTDLAAVCITEEFPYINIPNCLGDINDMFVTLTFRTPEADEVSGGGWTNLVNGCRELQVIDDWIMKPDVVVCPQMPEQVRSIITPMVTFALALGVITFVANRQGIRGLG